MQGRAVVDLDAQGALTARLRLRAAARERRDASASTGRRPAQTSSNGHIVVPAEATQGRRQRDRDRVRRGRRGAQSQRRIPLHAVRSRARAARVSVLRPARSEGALPAAARRCPRLAGRGQRREPRSRPGAHRARRGASGSIRGDAAAADLSLRVCGGEVFRRDRDSRRPRRSGCSTARRTRPRSRATATRSSTCTPGRWRGSRTTPPSRIPSASSTSS